MKTYYKLLEYSSDMDLTEFYKEASSQGYINNSNQKIMIDAFKNEERAQVWILFKEDKAMGAVAAHTFPEMGENSYRILTRTCAVGGMMHSAGSMGKMKRNEDITSRFYVPKMIEWCGKDSNMYCTTNDLEGGSQRAVHRVWLPIMAKQRLFTKIKEIDYRGVVQTVWKLNPDNFLQHLKNNPWEDHVLL